MELGLQLSQTLKQCLLFLGLSLSFGVAHGIEFEPDKYQIYAIDIDEDGVEELYFHPNILFVLVHSSVAIPLKTPEQDSLVFDDGVLAFTEALIDNQVANLTPIGPPTVQYGDFNGDSQLDIFLANQGNNEAFVALANDSDELPLTTVFFPFTPLK